MNKNVQMHTNSDYISSAQTSMLTPPSLVPVLLIATWPEIVSICFSLLPILFKYLHNKSLDFSIVLIMADGLISLIFSRWELSNPLDILLHPHMQWSWNMKTDRLKVHLYCNTSEGQLSSSAHNFTAFPESMDYWVIISFTLKPWLPVSCRISEFCLLYNKSYTLVYTGLSVHFC